MPPRRMNASTKMLKSMPPYWHTASTDDSIALRTVGSELLPMRLVTITATDPSS